MSTRIERTLGAVNPAEDVSSPLADLEDRQAFKAAAARQLDGNDAAGGPAERTQSGEPDYWADLPAMERNHNKRSFLCRTMKPIK